MSRKVLDEFCTEILDCEHKTAPRTDAGYPSIRTPNIGRGFFILDNVYRVNQETYEKWTQRGIPEAGNIILAREAPVGNLAMVPKGLKPCLGQRTVLIKPDRAKVDPRYLTYLLLGDEVQGHIHSQTNGSTVAHLNMRDIRGLPLPPLPDLPTQRKIAGILSAYDDLIENNLRRIKILEQMAQSLYREWFVHFRFPGHESAIFKDSELGRLPEGWEVKKLETIYKTSSGGTPSRKVTEYYDNGTIDWVKTGELRDCFILSSDEKITAEALKKSSAKLFPANTVLIALYGATIGQLGILSGEAATNQACCAILELHKPFGRAFAYLTLLLRREDIIGMRLGAAQQNISQAILRDFEVLFPSSSLLEQFNERVEPIFDLLLNLQNRNQNLHSTRELLLPKFLS